MSHIYKLIEPDAGGVCFNSSARAFGLLVETLPCNHWIVSDIDVSEELNSVDHPLSQRLAADGYGSYSKEEMTALILEMKTVYDLAAFGFTEEIKIPHYNIDALEGSAMVVIYLYHAEGWFVALDDDTAETLTVKTADDKV